MASASAVECTATVAMPEFLARPLDAQRDLTTIGDQDFVEHGARFIPAPRGVGPRGRFWNEGQLFYDHEGLAELDRLAVLEQDLRHGAGFRRRDLVHGLHRLDDQ